MFVSFFIDGRPKRFGLSNQKLAPSKKNTKNQPGGLGKT